MINRVVTNPGHITVHDHHGLADTLGEVRARASVSSLVLYPRTSSHSFISGTGEEVGPPTISGRCVTAAIVVIGMAEVLVASTVSSAQMASRRPEDLGLDLQLLEDRLDDDLRVSPAASGRWSS